MQAAIVILDRLAELYILLIFVRVIYSWVRPQGGSGFAYNFIYQTTQPIFALVHKIFPKTTVGMLDLSPLLALLAVDLIRYAILWLLVRL